MPNRIIQSLWIGPCLSAMEQLCLNSFLKHGHEFHLYVYQDTGCVPPGTLLHDANEILPASRIFTSSRHPTYALFADFFRYKLLLERGGWWVDADTVCLRAFDFPQPYVFSSEGLNGCRELNNTVLKAPPGSRIMEHAWEACRRMDLRRLEWGQSGTVLMSRAISLFSLQRYVQPPSVFCPVHYSEWKKLLDPKVAWSFSDQTRAVHLWNEKWRREKKSKDKRYNGRCLYEQLKLRYLDRSIGHLVSRKVTEPPPG